MSLQAESQTGYSGPAPPGPYGDARYPPPTLPPMASLLRHDEHPQVPFTARQFQPPYNMTKHPLWLAQSDPQAPVHHLYYPPQPPNSQPQAIPPTLIPQQHDLAVPMTHRVPIAQRRQIKKISQRRADHPKDQLARGGSAELPIRYERPEERYPEASQPRPLYAERSPIQAYPQERQDGRFDERGQVKVEDYTQRSPTNPFNPERSYEQSRFNTERSQPQPEPYLTERSQPQGERYLPEARPEQYSRDPVGRNSPHESSSRRESAQSDPRRMSSQSQGSRSMPISGLLSDNPSPTLERSQPQFRIRMRQQPLAARACGFGERDRRVIDPPPILQMDVTDPNATPEELRALIRQPYAVVHCTLWDPVADCDDTAMPGTTDKRQQRRLMGTLVSSPFVGNDENGVEGCFFTFPDLSVRTPGTYSLRFNLVCLDPTRMILGSREPVRSTVKSSVFHVYNAKDFGGMRASTELTKILKQQGCLISVKKGNSKSNGPHSRDDDDDDEEEDDDEGISKRGKRTKR